MLFVAFLHSKSLAPETIKSYLAAVRFHQIARGLADPKISQMPQLEYVIKGIKRSSPVSSRCRLPITPTILMDLKRVWQRGKNPYKAALLWAASCLCFFGFLRSGEVVAPSETEFDQSTHLCLTDVKVDSHLKPSRLEICIKASKTDPFRQGFTIHLGATYRALCPVEAMLGFLILRGDGPGALFKWQSGKFLTRAVFVDKLRSALTAAGHSAEKYAGHGFRIGAATTAAQCGMEDSLIKTLGRWESSAYMRYIRTPKATLQAVSGRLVSRM